MVGDVGELGHDRGAERGEHVRVVRGGAAHRATAVARAVGDRVGAVGAIGVGEEPAQDAPRHDGDGGAVPPRGADRTRRRGHDAGERADVVVVGGNEVRDRRAHRRVEVRRRRPRRARDVQDRERRDAPPCGVRAVAREAPRDGVFRERPRADAAAERETKEKRPRPPRGDEARRPRTGGR